MIIHANVGIHLNALYSESDKMKIFKKANSVALVLILIGFISCDHKIDKFYLPSDTISCSVLNEVMLFDSLYNRDSIPVFNRYAIFNIDRNSTNDFPPPPLVYSKYFSTQDIRVFFRRLKYDFTPKDSIYFRVQTDSLKNRDLSDNHVNFKTIKALRDAKHTDKGLMLIIFHKPLFTYDKNYAFIQYDIVVGEFFCTSLHEDDKNGQTNILILKNINGKWQPVLRDKIRK
jgi:hypothetical protein